MDEDENLRQALDGMLDEYMTLDPVTIEDGDKSSHSSPDVQAIASTPESDAPVKYIADSSDAFDATSVKISPSLAKVGEDSNKQKRSTILDGSADIFSRFLSEMVDAHALEACSDQQQISMETTYRIIDEFRRCNLKLSHDFPAVQRDVMKCLNLVDSICCDMQKTEESIARTKKLLHIDSLRQIPTNARGAASIDV